MAYALARLECRLVLTATTESKLSEVKQKCLGMVLKFEKESIEFKLDLIDSKIIAESKGSLTSDDVVVCPFDWCDLSAHQSIVAKVFERFGTIDVLFVNAARIRVNLFENLDHSDWDFIYKCNLMAPLSLIRHVISKWRSQGRPGRIMFTSSLTACTVVPLYACYASAKVAMQVGLDKLFS